MLPFKPDFPQTSPLGSFIQGAIGGYTAKKQIENADKRNQLAEIQAKLDERKVAVQEHLALAKTWEGITALGKADPEIRKLVLPKLMKAQGVDPASEDVKAFTSAFAKKDSAVAAMITRVAPALAQAGIGMRELINLYNNDITTFMKLAATADANATKKMIGDTVAKAGGLNPQAVGAVAQTGDTKAAQQLGSAYKATQPQQPLVNIQNKAESAGSVELAKIRAKRQGERANEAKAAQRAISNLNVLEPLLNKAGAGPGAPQQIAIKRGLAGAAKVMGVPGLAEYVGGDQVAAADAATAITNNLTLQLKNAFNLGVRGFDTPAERQFVENLSPGLGTTKKGRDALFFMLKKSYGRQVDINRAARRYIDKNGLSGVDEYLDQQFSGKPVFSEADKQRITKLLAGSEAQQTGSAPNIESMSLEQLQALDASKMSAEELRRAAARYRQLGGQ